MKAKKDLFDTTDITKFLFVDDENGHFIIEGPLNRYITYQAFKNEYVNLYKKYEKDGLELSDFYYKLEKKLNKMGITIQAIDYASYNGLFKS